MLKKSKPEWYQSVDIRSVSRDDLADLTSFDHSRNQSRKNHPKHFEKAMKNPYIFTASDMIVKLCFDNTVDLDTALAKGLCG